MTFTLWRSIEDRPGLTGGNAEASSRERRWLPNTTWPPLFFRKCKHAPRKLTKQTYKYKKRAVRSGRVCARMSQRSSWVSQRHRGGGPAAVPYPSSFRSLSRTPPGPRGCLQAPVCRLLQPLSLPSLSSSPGSLIIPRVHLGFPSVSGSLAHAPLESGSLSPVPRPQQHPERRLAPVGLDRDNLTTDCVFFSLVLILL